MHCTCGGTSHLNERTSCLLLLPSAKIMQSKKYAWDCCYTTSWENAITCSIQLVTCNSGVCYTNYSTLLASEASTSICEDRTNDFFSSLGSIERLDITPSKLSKSSDQSRPKSQKSRLAMHKQSLQSPHPASITICTTITVTSPIEHSQLQPRILPPTRDQGTFSTIILFISSHLTPPSKEIKVRRNNILKESGNSQTALYNIRDQGLSA